MPFPLDHYIEASHVDYKERLEEKKPRSWLKSVSAFANTEGGHLIFGVKNEPREVVGLENPQAVVSRLTELIKVRIDPTPRYRVREVEILFFQILKRRGQQCKTDITHSIRTGQGIKGLVHTL